MSVMMKFSNNASSRLYASIDPITTSIRVQAGDGVKFPTVVPPDEYYTVTIEDRRTGQVEICKGTSKSGDILNVLRGQEGTVAQAFAMGATVSNRLTAATMDFLAHAGATGPARTAGRHWAARAARAARHKGRYRSGQHGARSAGFAGHTGQYRAARRKGRCWSAGQRLGRRAIRVRRVTLEPQGNTGPQGVPGNQGPQGIQGPVGATGTGILMKGSVATTASLPPTGNAQGDAYHRAGR